MLELHALEWYTLSGPDRHAGKRVANINSEQLPPGPPDAHDLLNQEVIIDGTHYIVTGVESCRVMHHDLWRENKRCDRGYGLLVKEMTTGHVNSTCPTDMPA